MPVKFHCLFCLQVMVSFLAVEFTTRSHSRDQSGLFYKRGNHFNTSEVKHVSDSLVILSIYSVVKIGIYKQIDRSERNRSREFKLKVRSEIFPAKANFFYQLMFSLCFDFLLLAVCDSLKDPLAITFSWTAGWNI